MRSRLEEARKTPLFRVWDLVLYALILVLVVVLFLAVGLKPSAGKLERVEALRDSDVIFSYDFLTDTYTVSDGVEVEKTEQGYRVTVRTGDEGYNVFEIDKGGSVKMVEANCSKHKECVNYMPAITDADGVILCAPHHLTITGGSSDIKDPVIG